MKILRMLKTLITVRGLEVLLLGREVTLPDGISLGVVVDIERELRFETETGTGTETENLYL